jgi:hypothetical protein
MQAAFLLAAASLLVASVSGAESDDQSWFKAVGPRDWLVNYDPTLLGSRLYQETSYEQDRGGDYTLELRNEVRLARGALDNVAVGAQLGLPLKWARNSGGEISGLADYETRAGFVVRLARHFRWGCGLNVKIPTPTGTVLDGPWTELRPITAVSWDVCERLNLGINAAYYFTPANTGPDGTNKLEITLPVACKISEAWSFIVAGKPVYYLADASIDHRLQAGVTYLFGSHRQFAVFPAIEVPLGIQQLEWKARLQAVWSF